MALSYRNFDIEIGRTADGYAIRVESPSGHARGAFTVPLSEEDILALGNTVVRGARSTRGDHEAREPEDLKGYGRRLFESIFSDEVFARYQTSMEEVRQSSEEGLRLRFRLGDAPELARIPWEYLFDTRSNRFLALDDETPLIRYLDLPFPSAPLAVEGPLNVLVVISSPTDLPRLEVDKEWQRLNEALADVVASARVTLDRAESATLSALRWKLRDEAYHVLHFIGHGGVDDDGEGIVMLESDDGASDPVRADVIAGIVSAEKTLRLVVLNSCEGARAAAGDLFTGTAQTLVQQDIPAVIAMQFEISDEAAISLTHDFYKALSFGDPIDAALTEARRGLRWVQRNELEWGTPVLYTRVEDGRLFQVSRATTLTAPAREPATDPHWERVTAELLHRTRLATHRGEWNEATELLAELLEQDPGNREARALAITIRAEEEAAVLFQVAMEHLEAGREEEAREAFEKVLRVAGPDYRGVAARLETLEKELARKRRQRRVFFLRIRNLTIAVGLSVIVGTIVLPRFPFRPSGGDGVPALAEPVEEGADVEARAGDSPGSEPVGTPRPGGAPDDAPASTPRQPATRAPETRAPPSALAARPTAAELESLNTTIAYAHIKFDQGEFVLADSALMAGLVSSAALLGAYPGADTLRTLRFDMIRRRERVRSACVALAEVRGTRCPLNP